MSRSKSVAREHGRVAVITRWQPNSPELDAAKRDLKNANLRKSIQQAVSTWPPLSDEQRTRLAELLVPAREAIREHRLNALNAIPEHSPAALESQEVQAP